MDESEVEDGDCLGVSLGDPAAVDGAEFSVVEVTVRRRTVRFGIAVEAILTGTYIVFEFGEEELKWKSRQLNFLQIT
jgi:hypothetical protein